MTTDRDEHWGEAARAENVAEINREQFLSVVLDSLSEGVVACNADGELMLFNQATKTFHGLEKQSIPPRDWADYYSLHRADGTTMSPEEVPLARALAGEKVHDAVMVIAPSSADARTVLCSGGPIHDANGKLLGAVVVMRDISAQIVAEREKGDAAREREINRAKDEFLATLAHELRTPLTSILGWTQMLRIRDEEAARALAAIEQSTRMQAQLIEDLSDISRITAGKFLLKMEMLRLSQVLENAVTAVRPGAEHKHITITTHGNAAGVTVSADSLRLQQVFWNLLTNAIKFTPVGGSIDLSITTREHEVQIEVHDTGQGIPADFLPRIFDRYTQADNSRTFATGLGLGLSIARTIVKLHNGSISAYSEGEGKGATFTVNLPTA